MELKFSLEIPQNLWSDVQRKIVNAQTTLATEYKKACDIYTPMQQGTLKNNIEYTKNNAGAYNGWIYNSPYARRQWYGKKKDGTGFNYSKDTNPNARSRWTEHAWETHHDEILNSVINALEL